MKPDLQYSVLCEDVRQEKNGSFFFIGVTSVVRGIKFPLRMRQIFVVNGWCKGVGKHSQGIKVISRSDDRIIFGSNEVSFNLKELNDKKVIIAQFQNVAFPSPGDYSIEIHLDGELKLAYPLVIQKVHARGLPRPGDART